MDYQPNILLIVVDQWRWDCLGSAGHPVVQTPHLDVLASEGIRFSSAYSAVPSCIAARAGLLTGMHQNNHGRVGYQDKVPWTYPNMLADTFSKAGYHTQAVGKMHVFPARNLVGFHNVVLHDGYLHWNRQRTPGLSADDDYLIDLRRHHGIDADHIDSGIGCNGYAVAPWPYEIMLHPTAWVTSQSIDFLRRRDPTRPFFLKVSYHRPHPPLDPPQSYLDLYRGVELPSLPVGVWTDQPGLPNVAQLGNSLDSPRNIKPNQINLARKAYLAQCTFIDHQLNRIIMALNEHRLYENTAIIFVSDHGDMLFDHNLIAKSLPYQGSCAVPLLIKPPNSMEYTKNMIHDAPVELRDIYPTLCDISGIPIPESVDGRSLLPFLSGSDPSWRKNIHGEHTAGKFSNHWLSDGKTKYIWYSQTNRQQLFDLENDPYECKDISQIDPTRLARWRQELILALSGREEGYVREGELIQGRPVSPILEKANKILE